jgi:hypothetical protein
VGHLTSGRWDPKKNGRYFVGEFGPGYYTHIYAITPLGGGGCIKFGRATNVKSRFSGVQTGSPVKLTLLGSVFVPGEVESCIHDYLKDHRSHGEWFYPTVLATKVADIIAAGNAKELIAELSLYRFLPRHERVKEEFEERMSGPRSL